MQITVMGAGVAGLACAVELAERGADVEVVDQGERLGASGCSWYAGGMLAPWCELESAEPLIAKLGTESIAWWRERLPGTALNGSLVVAHGRDTGELASFSRRTEQFEWLEGDRIAALEPDLGGRFNKALYFKDEGNLDPRAALAAIAARDVLTDLRGVKGEMLLLRLRDISLSRPVRVLHPRMPLYIVPRGDGLFMVGATMIESDQPTRISARSMLELLSAAYALHPAFGEAEIVEIGTGVRPAFPDNLPRIRWYEDTLYVNGLFRHGFLLAPALARRVAGILLGGRYFPEGQDEDPGERRLA